MQMPELAVVVFWLALAISLSFSVLAAIDSWREYFEVRWAYQWAKEQFDNGHLRIARFRKVGGFWYVVAFNTMALVFILVSHGALVDPPSADETSFRQAATRIFAMFVVVAFWRTMRGQRRIRAELAELEKLEQPNPEAYPKEDNDARLSRDD